MGAQRLIAVTSEGSRRTHSGLIVIDESAVDVPGRPGLVYVVASALLISGRGVVRQDVRDCLGFGRGRSRPFHWTKERDGVRMAVCRLAGSLTARIDLAKVVDVPAKSQEAARGVALASIFDQLSDDGVRIREILFESRDQSNKAFEQNKVDHGSIIEARRRGSLRPKVPYGWVGKEEELVWLADAAAGVAAWAARGDRRFLDEVVARTQVVEHTLRLP
jgi:hypothetical protein